MRTADLGGNRVPRRSRGVRGLAMVPLKRRRVAPSASSGHPSPPRTPQHPDVVIFLNERKMGASRRAFLTRLGRSKGFVVEESCSDSVTHIVSEHNSGEEVQAWLESQSIPKGIVDSVHLLDISWFTESMGSGEPISIQDRHKLKVNDKLRLDPPEFTVKNYACQRRTPLKHNNTHLTHALELLAESAAFGENEGRSVAFTRAASVLKTLPRSVQRIEELRGLPCLGEHSLRVIKEILEYGASQEVESTRQSEQYQAMKALTGIFGVGVKTADRWYREGVRRPSDLMDSEQKLNQAQQAGLQHYKDLNTCVSKAEADAIGVIVDQAVQAVLPGAQITLTGGFRRGKESGHDVDFLITHPEEGKEEGLMPKVVNWLDTQGLLLYQKTTRNSYLESKDGPARPPSNMDRFERCFSIFKLESQSCSPPEREKSHQWKAVRVDLVVSPFSQFAFAVLGWTGSKLFERDLRRYAGQVKNMSLNSHSLFDSHQRCFLRATSEEEIFSLLGLEYIPACDRNA
ncbi:DNA-directed DNA/RNA polymerase mu isoform X1 [Denticeps clupeoides]|uniref:DNA-directed DNA/RNA polymerase mu isoform X1 n=1 Tax=Denticeps clupeoides TaxID=299321 RepID=UPI0010A2F125|nr:DNA-directed DNA/RNA polymerase mu isoform X1 [Denticeps clupeoides]